MLEKGILADDTEFSEALSVSPEHRQLDGVVIQLEYPGPRGPMIPAYSGTDLQSSLKLRPKHVFVPREISKLGWFLRQLPWTKPNSPDPVAQVL